jgi:FMN phosphatase YigB (HAD superfamily)
MLRSLFLLLLSFLCFENSLQSSDNNTSAAGPPQEKVAPVQEERLPQITCICVDPTVLFEVGAKGMGAAIIAQSSWKQKFKHTVQLATGTTERDLYPLLEKAPAKSTTYTYNKGVRAPLILSDWYRGNQTIESRTRAFLYSSEHSLASLTRATVAVLSNPGTVAQHHHPIKANFGVFAALKKRYRGALTVCMTGNYASPESLRFYHGIALELFDEIHLSGDMKLVKPDPRFFGAVVAETGSPAQTTLFVETEAQHCPPPETGIRSLVVDPQDRNALIVGLLKQGVHLKEKEL